MQRGLNAPEGPSQYDQYDPWYGDRNGQANRRSPQHRQ